MQRCKKLEALNTKKPQEKQTKNPTKKPTTTTKQKTKKTKPHTTMQEKRGTVYFLVDKDCCHLIKADGVKSSWLSPFLEVYIVSEITYYKTK